MEITQYKFIKELPDALREQMVGWGYIVETKPEEKPCDHKNASISYGPDGWFCSRCGVHKYETKPEEKSMECKHHGLGPVYKKNGNLLCGLCHKNCRIIYKEDQPDHDKAMEIPEVPDMKLDFQTEYDRDCIFIKQLELLTNSLNAVIKKINNL